MEVLEDSAVTDVEGVLVQEVSATVQVVVDYSVAVEVVAEDLDQVDDLAVGRLEDPSSGEFGSSPIQEFRIPSGGFSSSAYGQILEQS